MTARWYGAAGYGNYAPRPFYWVETQADYDALPLRPAAPPEIARIVPPLVWETAMPLTWAKVVVALGPGFSTTVLSFTGDKRAEGVRLTSALFSSARAFEQIGAKEVSTAESSEHAAWRTEIAALGSTFDALAASLPPTTDLQPSPSETLAARLAAALKRLDLTDDQRFKLLGLQLRLTRASEPPFYVADFYRKARSPYPLNSKTYAEWSLDFKNALLTLKAFLLGVLILTSPALPEAPAPSAATVLAGLAIPDDYANQLRARGYDVQPPAIPDEAALDLAVAQLRASPPDTPQYVIDAGLSLYGALRGLS
jgi:hypothetical protein